MGSILLRKTCVLGRLLRLSTTATIASTTTASIVSRPKLSSGSLPLSCSMRQPLFFSSPFAHRSLSSSPSAAGSSNVVVINSQEELDSSIGKAQDGALPSVFYFTAVWCGPCRHISPLVEELSKKYPHVTTYKIDIDLDGLGSTLNKLNISAVPTLHFFYNGKKEAEVVGADPAKLKQIMEKLYKT